MEIVGAEPVTVMYGETGSEKTTQLPQFLYEHGYTLPNGSVPLSTVIVCVVQWRRDDMPRRVAAVTMSQRVAYEMELSQKYCTHTTQETVVP